MFEQPQALKPKAQALANPKPHQSLTLKAYPDTIEQLHSRFNSAALVLRVYDPSCTAMKRKAEDQCGRYGLAFKT